MAFSGNAHLDLQVTVRCVKLPPNCVASSCGRQRRLRLVVIFQTLREVRDSACQSLSHVLRAGPRVRRLNSERWGRDRSFPPPRLGSWRLTGEHVFSERSGVGAVGLHGWDSPGTRPPPRRHLSRRHRGWMAPGGYLAPECAERTVGPSGRAAGLRCPCPGPWGGSSPPCPAARAPGCRPFTR